MKEEITSDYFAKEDFIKHASIEILAGIVSNDKVVLGLNHVLHSEMAVQYAESLWHSLSSRQIN